MVINPLNASHLLTPSQALQPVCALFRVSHIRHASMMIVADGAQSWHDAAGVLISFLFADLHPRLVYEFMRGHKKIWPHLSHG
jgi:hypothetical protein